MSRSADYMINMINECGEFFQFILKLSVIIVNIRINVFDKLLLDSNGHW